MEISQFFTDAMVKFASIYFLQIYFVANQTILLNRFDSSVTELTLLGKHTFGGEGVEGVFAQCASTPVY